MSTRVSLVTPTYNQAAFLPATIASVLAQTHPALDYHVIDDGSTDDTPAVLARYAGRVRSERQANAGQAATLNRGWAEAGGEYLGYLSSDDLLAPGCVAEVAAALDAVPEAVCAFPQCDLIDAHGAVLKRAICRPFDLPALIVEQECWIGPGALFRAAAFRRIGGWDPALRLAPDREFWMRLAREGRFLFVERTLASYRLHPRATSFALTSEAQSREYLAVLDRYFAAGSVPTAIAARRDEAYGRANLLIARNLLREGRIGLALDYAREALRLHPPLAKASVAACLLRAAVGKPVRMAQSRLRRAFG